MVAYEVIPALFWFLFSTVMAKPCSLTETALNRLALEKENDALDPDLFSGAYTKFLLNSAPV